MSIKISTKQIIVRGEKFIEVVNIEALKTDQIPVAYFSTPGSISIHRGFRGDGLMFLGSDMLRGYLLFPGDVYGVAKFEGAMKKIRAAGKLLRKINAELAKENEGWEKEVEYMV